MNGAGQHGEALRSEIYAALDRWRDVLRAEGFEPRTRVDVLVGGAGFVAAASRLH